VIVPFTSAIPVQIPEFQQLPHNGVANNHADATSGKIHIGRRHQRAGSVETPIPKNKIWQPSKRAPPLPFNNSLRSYFITISKLIEIRFFFFLNNE